MLWCPNCKTEYRDGFSICADCGTTLVEKLPEEETIITDYGFDFNKIIEPCFLISVSNEIKCKLIENLLSDANIPCFSKDNGCGTYLRVYFGNSIYGTNIYVDKCDFDKAKEIIDVYVSKKVNEVKIVPLKEKDNKSFFVRKIVMRIIIALIFIPTIAFLFFGLGNLIVKLIS